MEAAAKTKVFGKPDTLTGVPYYYCPGCGHSLIHRLVCEVIDEFEMAGDTVAIFGVGCSCVSYPFFNLDWIYTLHGRAPAVATGFKRSMPDTLVFTYQGDGDLGSIGIAEIIHAAHRGEKFTTIFVNNANYGMTGGQMAPTTLEGQITTTTPEGRDIAHCGSPLKISEMLATIDGAKYVARQSVHDYKSLVATRKSIKKAFEVQLAGEGFSIVEILSQCPTNWKIEPVDSCAWIEENMMPVFPLGILKDESGG